MQDHRLAIVLGSYSDSEPMSDSSSDPVSYLVVVDLPLLGTFFFTDLPFRVDPRESTGLLFEGVLS